MMTNKPTTKKSLMILSIIAGVFIILLFFLYGGRLHSNLEIRKEQNRLDGILNQINQLYIENEELEKERKRLDNEQIAKNNEYNEKKDGLHNSADENRTKIDELREEYDNAKLFLMAGQEKSK